MKQLSHEFLTTIWTTIAALIPSAIGATIAQFYEQNLHWRDRCAAYLVGVSVSWYSVVGLKSFFHFDEFFAQSTSFLIALFAYRATPRFIQTASDAASSLPNLIKDKIFGGKK